VFLWEHLERIPLAGLNVDGLLYGAIVSGAESLTCAILLLFLVQRLRSQISERINEREADDYYN
jgi:hypothetical protein